MQVDSDYAYGHNEHKAASLAKWEHHGLVSVGITSAPEPAGANGADASRQEAADVTHASLTPPPDMRTPDMKDLNRRAWDLLKRAEGYMLNPVEEHHTDAGDVVVEVDGERVVKILPGFDAESHGMRISVEFNEAQILLAEDGSTQPYAGSSIAEVSLKPQLAGEDAPPAPGSLCPGLRLTLRKSRLKNVYDISLGRLGIIDVRPKAKHDPETYPFREFLAPVTRTSREAARDTTPSPKPTMSKGHSRRHTFQRLPSRRTVGSPRLQPVSPIPHLRAHDAPLLCVKWEKTKSFVPSFLLPAEDGQLVVGPDDKVVGWRYPDGRVVAPGPGGTGGGPGPPLETDTKVQPDGAVVCNGQPLGESRWRLRPDAPSSKLELEISHATVVLLLDFVKDLGKWSGAKVARFLQPPERLAAEFRARNDRYDALYPTPTAKVPKPSSMLALGGAPVEYMITLEDVFIALPDLNPSPSCIEKKRGWAFCVALGGDVSIEGEALGAEDSDARAFLHVLSSPTEETVTLQGTLRMLTCLMDTVPDGEINLTPAGGHHLMLDPTPLRLFYKAVLHPGTEAQDDVLGHIAETKPWVHREIELHVNALPSKGEEDDAVEGALDILPPDDQMEIFDVDDEEEELDEDGHVVEHTAKDFNATAFDLQVLIAGIAGLSSGQDSGGGEPAADKAADKSPPAQLAVRQAPCWLQQTKVDLWVHKLSLMCHGEIFAKERPMLQLNLRRAMVHLERKQLLNEPSPEKEKVQAYVPRASSELRLHTALQLDAQYLNMNINELEPLIEPWQMSGHAVKPLGRGDETGRILSGRLYSSRLLQLNLSMALQRTLTHLKTVQQKAFDRSYRPVTNDDLKKLYTVEDRASGIAGRFLTDEKSERRASVASRSSQQRDSIMTGLQIHLPGLGGHHPDFGDSESAHLSREPGEEVLKHLVLQLVGTQGEPRWTPTVRISLSECRLNAHRVWRRGAAVSPHAVLISEVRPNEAAGKSILLRSNLTLHNTLMCKLYVFLETFHESAALGNQVWKVLAPGRTYNIPLHLTNQTRLVLRPWVAGLVQEELLHLDPKDYGGAAPEQKVSCPRPSPSPPRHAPRPPLAPLRHRPPLAPSAPLTAPSSTRATRRRRRCTRRACSRPCSPSPSTWPAARRATARPSSRRTSGTRRAPTRWAAPARGAATRSTTTWAGARSCASTARPPRSTTRCGARRPRWWKVTSALSDGPAPPAPLDDLKAPPLLRASERRLRAWRLAIV